VREPGEIDAQLPHDCAQRQGFVTSCPVIDGVLFRVVFAVMAGAGSVLPRRFLRTQLLTATVNSSAELARNRPTPWTVITPP
jgi:hypothetical protein